MSEFKMKKEKSKMAGRAGPPVSSFAFCLLRF